MNGQTNMTEHMLTWLDVERCLKQRTALWTQLPNGVLSVDCYANGMEIRFSSSVDANDVDDWLSQTFGRAYQREPKAILLRIGNAQYPVELFPEADTITTAVGQSYPLWRDVTYIPANQENEYPVINKKSPQRFDSLVRFKDSPALISFHSFKGGVGRTSTLMTYVAACLRDTTEDAKKILVVDADLEAPGVSFWLDDANRATVSFIQLIEALHYPPAGLNTTLDFFANELRKTSLSIAGLQRELFILPAALDLTEIQDMPVTPEHLARNPENPWQLSDHLHALGKRLGADAVFIDLRAGLSELSSPILFDPRVDHFFVSTVAPQSVLGMVEVLRRLYTYNRQLPPSWQEEARPTLVLSMLTKELRDTGHYPRALKALEEAYPADDLLTPSVQWLEAEFSSTLMSIGSVREALDVLPQFNLLFLQASEWAKSLYAKPNQSSSSIDSKVNASAHSPRQALAKKLHQVCEDAEFAEGARESKILAIEPLLNLGKHFANELPNVLMIGAKGAGKTFTFRQLVRSISWRAFLEKLSFNQAKVTEAAIFPILWSDNIIDKPDGEIKIAQERALQLCGKGETRPLRRTDIKKRIDTAIKNPPPHWEDFWDDLIATQFGAAQGGLNAVNNILLRQSARTILVFDGIEDVFKDATEKHAVDAIQALLRLTNRISEISSPYLGVIIFVRADYVQTTIRQNSGQLLQRFQPFRLQWDAENFLRLAYMLSSQVIEYSPPRLAESLHLNELKTELEQLWGKKLGSEKSKEAHSARWVYAALCDLKGNVQARDLVRFLKFSADEESKRPGQTWPDRVLAPESMRRAIPRCSAEKVQEAKAEIAPLRKWIDIMADNHIHNVKVPFGTLDTKLDAALLNSLQEIGVIYEDTDGDLGEDRLFLPEIYRSGLGFETSAGGRPRMQALLKKNIGVIPL